MARRIGRALWIAAALCVLGAQDAAAEGAERPPGQCTITWEEPAAFAVYVSQRKGEWGTKFATIPERPATPPRTWSAACPTVPGQYYFSIGSIGSDGIETGRTYQIPFVITGTPPPTPGFALGSTVETVAALLNVRGSPAIPSAILGTKPKGAKGTIVGGPVTASGYTWWQIQFPGNIAASSGWCAETFLRPSTP